MADTDDDTQTLPGMPLMPTGNGVTDLEIAREQAAVAHATPAPRGTDDAADGLRGDGSDVPLDDGRPTLSE